MRSGKPYGFPLLCFAFSGWFLDTFEVFCSTSRKDGHPDLFCIFWSWTHQKPELAAASCPPVENHDGWGSLGFGSARVGPPPT